MAVTVCMSEHALDRVAQLLASATGRSDAQAVELVERYVAFLGACHESGEALPPPDAAVDLAWHLHMLHPAAYRDHCVARFGRLVDHRLGDVDHAVVALATAGCNGPA